MFNFEQIRKIDATVAKTDQKPLFPSLPYGYFYDYCLALWSLAPGFSPLASFERPLPGLQNRWLETIAVSKLSLSS